MGQRTLRESHLVPDDVTALIKVGEGSLPIPIALLVPSAMAFDHIGIGSRFDPDELTETLSQATGLDASGIIERAYLDVVCERSMRGLHLLNLVGGLVWLSPNTVDDREEAACEDRRAWLLE
jgi:hypothetical protein